jgi:hypothetical protein
MVTAAVDKPQHLLPHLGDNLRHHRHHRRREVGPHLEGNPFHPIDYERRWQLLQGARQLDGLCHPEGVRGCPREHGREGLRTSRKAMQGPRAGTSTHGIHEHHGVSVLPQRQQRCPLPCSGHDRHPIERVLL